MGRELVLDGHVLPGRVGERPEALLPVEVTVSVLVLSDVGGGDDST